LKITGCASIGDLVDGSSASHSTAQATGDDTDIEQPLEDVDDDNIRRQEASMDWRWTKCTVFHYRQLYYKHTDVTWQLHFSVS